MAEGMSAREFLERELRNDPNLSFAEVQERGRRLGLNIPPFLYGSARRSLGLPARRDLVEPSVSASEPSPAPAIVDAIDDAHDESEAATADDVGEREPADEPAPASAKVESKNSAFQFAIDTLKLSPDLSFADLKTRAQMAGLKMQPIVYGRAKALLGLVPTKPRQPRKKAEPEAPRMLRQVESAAQFTPPAPTPTPRQSAAVSTTLPSSLGSLEQLIGVVRDLEADRHRLRAILTAIKDAVDEALSVDEG
jgi:hypothetical protein